MSIETHANGALGIPSGRAIPNGSCVEPFALWQTVQDAQ